jgi:VIT1/CCC1 family predicted Fe2+/Mn2+ transporter
MTAQLPTQEYKEQEYIDRVSEIREISENTAALGNSQLATIPKSQTASSVESDLEKIGVQISDFLASFPHHVAWFYSEYKFLVDGFAALVVTVLALRIMLAIVGAFNSIPLLKEFFQLIGIGYTGWFINRYLKNETNRKELAAKVDSIKQEIN